METPEQYTVKTPEEANIKLAVDLYQKYNGILLSFERHIYSSMEEYASVKNAELIKENERLREENKLYREALTELLEGLALESKHNPELKRSIVVNVRIGNAQRALSKFQPKKDESIEQRG